MNMKKIQNQTINNFASIQPCPRLSAPTRLSVTAGLLRVMSMPVTSLSTMKQMSSHKSNVKYAHFPLIELWEFQESYNADTLFVKLVSWSWDKEEGKIWRTYNVLIAEMSHRSFRSETYLKTNTCSKESLKCSLWTYFRRMRQLSDSVLKVSPLSKREKDICNILIDYNLLTASLNQKL